MQAGVCLGESIDYVYDGEDHLRRATKRVAGVVQGSEEYWYDNAEQRIAIIRRDAAGDKTELVWFLGDTEAHLDGTGTLTRVYSHISLGTPVARVERTSDTSAPTEFQFHGLASSTIAAVAYDGTSNAGFCYTPFGELLESSGVESHQRRFNDQQHDELSGLTYYGFRFSDQVLVGWTQSDPTFRFAPEESWSEPRLANLYTFTLNNSLRYLDPDGRQPAWESPGAEIVHDFVGDREAWERGKNNGANRARSLIVRIVATRLPPLIGALVNVANDALDQATMEDSGASDDDDDDDLNMAMPPPPGGVTFPAHGNSRGSNRTQHSYDIVRKPGGTKPPGVVKTGVSGRGLNQDGSSGRANTQVNSLNRNEKGMNEYEAVVTKKNVTATKTKTARGRILDYEKRRSANHIKAGKPMDKHKRPRPPDDKKPQ